MIIDAGHRRQLRPVSQKDPPDHIHLIEPGTATAKPDNA
jgi:hypothetical protein